MCDINLLNELKSRQVKLDELECKCSHKCWCNQLSFRFPLDQPPGDECMSPTEMLDKYGSQMDKDDIKYLKSLSHKTFIA